MLCKIIPGFFTNNTKQIKMKFDEILIRFEFIQLTTTSDYIMGLDNSIMGQKSWYETCWYDPTPHRLSLLILKLLER